MNSTSTTNADILQKRLDSLPLSNYYYKVWFLCTTAGVLDSMDLYLISFALPMIATEWGIGSDKIGILASAAMWGMLAGAYLWGYLSDLIGRRKSLISTVGIFGVIRFVVDISLPAVFITLSGFLFIMTLLISIFAFETKGKSLEEIAS